MAVFLGVKANHWTFTYGIKSKRMMDMACGNGFYAIELAKKVIY